MTDARGGIRNRITKAEADLGVSDFENALIQTLIAVAATSRKRYPTKTDRQRFEAFLQDELAPKIQPNTAIVGGSMKVACGDELLDLEDVLYAIVRCGLLHEAGVPPLVTFVQRNGFYVQPRSDTLEIGRGVVDVLIRIVKEAPENADLFVVPPA
jgi:hypothetical protein